MGIVVLEDDFVLWNSITHDNISTTEYNSEERLLGTLKAFKSLYTPASATAECLTLGENPDLNTQKTNHFYMSTRPTGG